MVQLDDAKFTWKYPALQLTHVPAADPAYWPAGQLEQLVAPTVAEYVPVGQPRQAEREIDQTVEE